MNKQEYLALIKELREAAHEEDNHIGIQQDFYHAELLRKAADMMETTARIFDIYLHSTSQTQR